MSRTAAALVIGNEILTGKTQEQNIQLLATELFSLGISLRRVIIAPDEIDVIAADLNVLRQDHDFVFTSGGVGPTHDDITIDAVAGGVGGPPRRSAEVESMIRAYYGERVTEEHLRMANMPDGAQLLRNATLPWPTIVIENVFLLPGVPQIFKMKLAALRAGLQGDQPFVSEAVYTMADEGELAALLQRLTRDHPAVSIGSYPRFGDPAYKVKLTFDSRDADAARRAADALVAALPAEKIVRRER